ncbi:hypothetical protein ACG0Z6_13725 [Roseateles sp. BYS180W]|uniref:DUF2214 domain-containing protein n=1 Tax=Roseateles rivi TaxID=3299028 RepID=A0ABW7FYB6_9BURK
MEVWTTALRQLLLMAHTLAFAFAIVALLRADLAMLRTQRIDAAKLAATESLIARMLGLLWLTGGALVLLDPNLQWHALVLPPKLATKLTVVTLLTINGAVLHWVVFPKLTQPQDSPHAAAALCAVTGAISSVTWLYATFLGVGRLIAPIMNYGLFMGLYGLGLMVGVLVAMLFVRPRLERLMASGGRPELRQVRA